MQSYTCATKSGKGLEFGQKETDNLDHYWTEDHLRNCPVLFPEVEALADIYPHVNHKS